MVDFIQTGFHKIDLRFLRLNLESTNLNIVIVGYNTIRYIFTAMDEFM